MRQFLFLYPIKPYINFLEEWTNPPHDKRFDTRRLNLIIRARYRQNGYGINWVLFGKENVPSMPDLSLASELIEIDSDDRVLSSGISFKRHTTKMPDGNYPYPEPSFILSQLPLHERLVIGGFHQGDCVDKVARISYERGIDTFVDEDTTEHFFYRERLGGPIPLVRSNPSLRDAYKRSGLLNKLDYERIVRERKGKPWLVQS